jgi:TonB family protein
MKHFVIIFACIAALTLGSCDNKKKEEEKRAAELKAQQDSIDAAKTAWDERRARIKKDRDEYSERRRLAAEERAKANASYKDAKGRTVYYVVDVNPTFRGSQEQLEDYIKDNIEYPVSAQTDKIEGTVFVDFVVGSDGVVRDAEVAETTGEDVKQNLSAEALRVVQNMPAWTPGTKGGKPVDVRVSLPITFQLEM